jgi:hypothetical protein
MILDCVVLHVNKVQQCVPGICSLPNKSVSHAKPDSPLSILTVGIARKGA